MKIWWRQQEMLFVTFVFLVGLIELLSSRTEYLWQVTKFREKGLHYDYNVHTILPFLLVFAVPVLLLLLINGLIIPRFVNHRYRIGILLTTMLACWVILTLSFGLHYYLRFAFTGTDDRPGFNQEARRQGITLASISIITYLAYLAIRESVITWIERTKEENPFRVLVCNRITLGAFIYVLLMIIFANTGLFHSDGVAITYVFILLPVMITCFANIYFLYPVMDFQRKPFHKNLVRLSIIPAVLAFCAWLFYVMGSGNLRPVYSLILYMVIMVIATPVSWLFYIQQREKISTLLKLEKKLGQATADLAFLRSQVNPHFLFNTLNTLYGTALQEEASRTASGIQRLGDMMRFLLHDNNRDSIPLIREVEYLKHYIALQSLRVASSGGVRIETSISDTSCDHSISPMLLIPFVENAFKHGIRLTKPSYIITKFYCDEKGIYLDVVNSKHTKNDATTEEGYSGVGLENVKQRLALLYPGKHSLQIHEDDAAFQVRLFIHLREGE